MHVEDILPLSPLQEGLLFHALYAAQGPDVYTTQLQLNLQGRLDEATLKSAVQALLQRHASLRAGFQHENLSRPVQIIVASPELPWRSLDLSALDAASRNARLEEIVAQERAEHFDLATPPLIRFTLIRLSRGRAPAASHQPPHPDGRLVDAGADPRTAGALCQPGRRRIAAAGDALSRLSALDCGAGSLCGAYGLA